MNQVKLDRIVLDLQYGTGHFADGILSLSRTNIILVNDIEVYDVDDGSFGGTPRIFYIWWQTDLIVIRNVFAGTNMLDHDSTFCFCKIQYITGDVYLENIIIRDVYGINSFFIDDANNAYLNNITLDSVYEGTLFYLDDCSVFMNNIFVNGNTKYIYYSILRFSGGRLSINNVELMNFVSGNKAVPAIYLGDGSFDDKVEITNVSFINITANGTSYRYGLIYIDDNLPVTIDQCLFQDNIYWLSIVHCGIYSRCNVTVQNSVFLGNAGYNPGASVANSYCDKMEGLDGIYLEPNAHGNVVIDNNLFYQYVTIWYDETSEILLENNEIVAIKNLVSCRIGATNLYLSNNYNNKSIANINNDCTDSTNPCKKWGEIIDSIIPNDVVYIDSGKYDIFQPLSVNGIFNIHARYKSQNFTIIGNTTIAEVFSNVSQFIELKFDRYNYLLPNTSNQNIDCFANISTLIYSPQSPTHQQFGYFYYVTIVHLLNIVFNGTKTHGNDSNLQFNNHGNSYYDLVYGYSVDTFFGQNIEIHDIDRSSMQNRIFDFSHGVNFVLKDVLIANSNTYALNSASFVYLDNYYGGNVN